MRGRWTQSSVVMVAQDKTLDKEQRWGRGQLQVSVLGFKAKAAGVWNTAVLQGPERQGAQKDVEKRVPHTREPPSGVSRLPWPNSFSRKYHLDLSTQLAGSLLCPLAQIHSPHLNSPGQSDQGL